MQAVAKNKPLSAIFKIALLERFFYFQTKMVLSSGWADMLFYERILRYTRIKL
ncbi:hypothetical protein AO384_0457 [Moraxella catarrhalis]|uniref:Uncharacterized protein n=1 Tax=Moraxella catarrhalis TaxID=480 RepID=A0A198UN42_MORCA|nr:hypothetical protein AO383_1692 [Moraxella catarrhalis]OAU97771.1 hypothetical protein AO384_0457 [Moraxella catarrhalis]